MATLQEIALNMRTLRTANYGAAIDFQGLYKSAIIARLSRSRQRIGFSRKWLREPSAGILYSKRVSPRDRRHVIEINFALVEHLGVRTLLPDQWEFPLPRNEADDAYVQEQLASLEAGEFVVMNPGAGWQSKRWPPAQYAELIRSLEPEFGGKILLTGSPAEEGMIREIINLSRAKRADYFPSTLVQLIALLRRARLFLGGDTGPMHLAAALSTPVVALFGGTDPSNTPERNGPFSSDDITLTPPVAAIKPVGDHFIEGITTSAVLQAVRERLARPHG
jgi:ADP-heptose:LPS heptosyltransferase